MNIKIDEWFKAAKEGKYDVLERNMEEFKQKKDKNGWTALMWSAYYYHADCVRLLAPVELGMSSNSGLSALMLASWNNSIGCIPPLLGELGMRDNDVWTSLHWSCWKGYIESVKLLLDEAEVRDNEGRTPADVAR